MSMRSIFKNLIILVALATVQLNALDTAGLLKSFELSTFSVWPKTLEKYQRLLTVGLHDKLVALHSEDVFDYYDLGYDEAYSTPLQKKAFEASAEYATLLEGLRSQKADLPNKIFTIDLGVVSEYNLSTGAFQVPVNLFTNPVSRDTLTCDSKICNSKGRCEPQGCGNRINYGYVPNSILGFRFQEFALATDKRTSQQDPRQLRIDDFSNADFSRLEGSTKWSIKVPEAAAASIEREKATVRLAFTIKKHVKHKTRLDFSAQFRRNNMHLKHKELHDLIFDIFESKIVRIEFIGNAGNVIHSIDR